MSGTEYAATRALLQGIVDDGYVQIDHSWRCAHPDVYGACDCEEVAVRALHGAVAAHDAELSERVRNKDIADMRWLATARAEYDHVPNDISSTLAATEAERTLKTQHQSVSLVADILEGENDGAGWLPSWRWDDWNERREGKQ